MIWASLAMSLGSVGLSLFSLITSQRSIRRTRETLRRLETRRNDG